MLGYHVTGSAGALFLYGIATGALGLFGLSLLLAGAGSRQASPGRSPSRRPQRISLPWMSQPMRLPPQSDPREAAQ